MKTETCKLCSRVFWIFLPNFIKIDLYNFELYRFKVGAFFKTQCSTFILVTATKINMKNFINLKIFGVWERWSHAYLFNINVLFCARFKQRDARLRGKFLRILTEYHLHIWIVVFVADCNDRIKQRTCTCEWTSIWVQTPATYTLYTTLCSIKKNKPL